MYLKNNIQCRKCRNYFKKTKMNPIKTLASWKIYMCNPCFKIYNDNLYKIKHHIALPKRGKGYIHDNVKCWKCKKLKPKIELVNCGYTHPNEHKYKCKDGCNVGM